MRTLPELLASEDGRDLLAARGVYFDADSFAAALRPAEDAGLADLLGLDPGHRLVYVGQQAQCDYSWSVVAKFRAQQQVVREGIRPVNLPLDMDRVGSGPMNTVLRWPFEAKPPTARFTTRRLDDSEMRFAEVSPGRIKEVIETIDHWLGLWAAEEPGREVDRDRRDGFVAALTTDQPSTLPQVAQGLTDWLLDVALDVRLPTARVSTMIEAGLFDQTLDAVLDRIGDVIQVFNESVSGLQRLGVDAKVRPLAEDWLPLWFACPDDARRTRLRQEQSATWRGARGQCQGCRRVHRFEWDGDRPLAELRATGRWSVDVILPIFVDGLTSGVVAGQSTALYGLVMNDIIRHVVGRAPNPILVPAGDTMTPPDGVDSLFFHCITGSI